MVQQFWLPPCRNHWRKKAAYTPLFLLFSAAQGAVDRKDWEKAYKERFNIDLT
jgi:hypothetical protein